MTLAPTHWTRGRIKWDTVMVAGSTPSTDDDGFWLEGDDPSGTPFVAIADMSRRERVSATAKSLSAEGLASRSMPLGRPGILLFAMYASVGEVAFLDISATWNQALLGITPDPDKVDSRFLRYVLLDMRDDLLRDVRSNTQANLNAGQVGDIWFQQPPLEEQRAIADYLDRETARIDTLIEEQRCLIEMLHERRASEIAAGFAGPATTPLRQAVEYAQTGPFGTKLMADEYIDGGVPVINPTHIRRGLIVPDDSTTVTPEKAEDLVRYRLAVGDIVLGRKGEVDKSALVNQRSAGYVCGSDAMALRPRLGTVPDYLWWFLQSSEAHSQLEFWSVGATVSGLNQTTIRKVRLPLPDVQEQRRVTSYLVEKTEKIDTLITETERFIELARERRVALITAAVTGQIDVREMA